ncbi:MAG: DsbA family protein [candidate division NC10 bacterium]|nr:DsbA family protein [candidate division NC10 bacterium]
MQHLAAKHSGKVRLTRRAFCLRPQPDPTVRFKGTYREAAWQRASTSAADVGITFRMWTREDFPTTSLPAQQAAKAAERLGPDAFETAHLALFRAFFEEEVNIGSREEVIEVIRRAGLPLEGFLAEYEAPGLREAVLAEYFDAVHTHGISAIPTVVIGSEAPIVGAVPLAEYERLLAKHQPA